MRELNQFNRVTLQKFTSRQAYTFVKGHYIPIVMQSIGDESKIDTEDRRYYQQNYQFQLQGFLLDEEEFEVKPAISRSLVMYGFDTKNPRGDAKNMGEKNPDMVRKVVNFDSNTTEKNITYEYKNNIDVLRVTNVSSFSFKINNLTAELPLLINPTDVLTITIVKQTAGVESNMTLQEKIVR